MQQNPQEMILNIANFQHFSWKLVEIKMKAFILQKHKKRLIAKTGK